MRNEKKITVGMDDFHASLPSIKGRSKRQKDICLNIYSWGHITQSLNLYSVGKIYLGWSVFKHRL